MEVGGKGGSKPGLELQSQWRLVLEVGGEIVSIPGLRLKLGSEPGVWSENSPDWRLGLRLELKPGHEDSPGSGRKLGLETGIETENRLGLRLVLRWVAQVEIEGIPGLGPPHSGD